VKQVVYTKSARRTLSRLPQNTAQRINQKILEFAADPSSQANNVKALQGSSMIRLRVGDWRVIMDDGVVLEIVAIGSRGSVYG
jgi:mRNA interferase RelE/StbE